MNKIRRFCLLVIAILLLQILVIVPTSAADRVSGDYEYYFNHLDDPLSVSISKYNGNQKELVIPSQLNGYPVTKIMDHAFAGHGELTSVTIPETVNWVGYKSFANCTSLNSIVFSGATQDVFNNAFLNTAYYNDDANWQDGLFYIGAHLIDARQDIAGDVTVREGTTHISFDLFYKRTNLTGVTLPDSVVYVGSSAFYGCSALKNVKLSSRLETLGASAFVKCVSLEQIALPQNLKTLGSYAFSECALLKEVTLPENLTVISSGTFSDCISLQKVVLGDRVSKLERAAFADCPSLVSVNFPASLQSIGSWCFQDCVLLGEISVPQNVTYIDDKAFENTAYYNDPSHWTNDSLYIDGVLIEVKETVGGDYVIREGTRMLANYCMRRCELITSITVPQSVTVIGSSAFEGCRGIREITIPDSVRSLGFGFCRDCSSLERATIPDRLTEIPGYAFLGCTSLRDFEISSKVKKIGNGAFWNCDSFRLIYIPKSVKEIESLAFYSCDNLAHVLYGGSRKAWFDGVNHQAFDENMIVHRGTTRDLVMVMGDFMFCKKCQTTIRGQKSHKQFTDVYFGAWYHANGAVDFAYNAGLFGGTSATTFEPNTNMTRGMFVTVLGRLHGVASNGQLTRFSDVKKKDYFSAYVAWAEKNGIVNGTSKTTFSPNDNVSREQICTMMLRYMNYAEIPLKKVNQPMKFTDADMISAYAQKAVSACQTGGIVNGKDGGRFDPRGNATRAEVATILMNFCQNYKYN